MRLYQLDNLFIKNLGSPITCNVLCKINYKLIISCPPFRFNRDREEILLKHALGLLSWNLFLLIASLRIIRNILDTHFETFHCILETVVLVSNHYGTSYYTFFFSSSYIFLYNYNLATFLEWKHKRRYKTK